tara:strand:- start:1773 stop:3386 length:1614 start_codon:yes stop_codon:yes gene_type:complete
VFIDGVYQERAGYSVSGSDLVFSEAPPVLSTIEVLAWGVNDIGATTANLVTYTPAGTGAVAATVQDKLRESVSVKDFGAVGDGVTDDTAAIQAAEDWCAVSGQSIFFPASNYKCLTGIIKKAVNWIGEGKYDSKLSYYGNSTFINATGSTSDRRLFTISDMEINGTNGGDAAVGITLGWNMRSTPLIRVHIFSFGHYGIHFNDQNWIVDFYDVEVNLCGGSTTNSSGIYKDASVDAGTWNAISFYNLTVEACGSATSAAGAMNLATTSANRGLYFYSPCIEGNFGSTEIYISNMADCQFDNLYMEIVSAQCLGAVELYGVTGSLRGGYITGDNIAVNTIGIKVRASGAYVLPNIQIDGLTILNFIASVDAEAATVYTGNVYGDRVFVSTSASGQYYGEYSPRMSVVKNASQAVASATFTKVDFQTKVYDLTGGFAASRFTPITAGVYQVDASVNWLAAVDADKLILSIYLNGVAYKSSVTRASGTGEQGVNCSAQVKIASVTDYIEVYARQDSGVSQTISASTTESFFTAAHIGRAV